MDSIDFIKVDISWPITVVVFPWQQIIIYVLAGMHSDSLPTRRHLTYHKSCVASTAVSHSEARLLVVHADQHLFSASWSWQASEGHPACTWAKLRTTSSMTIIRQRARLYHYTTKVIMDRHRIRKRRRWRWCVTDVKCYSWSIWVTSFIWYGGVRHLTPCTQETKKPLSTRIST